MGQNGAGKSSIIKLLNGMLQVNTSSSLFLFLFMFLLCFFVLFYFFTDVSGEIFLFIAFYFGWGKVCRSDL
jgi:energy-coupling factor transporter ATP-binding protein EcfA2